MGRTIRGVLLRSSLRDVRCRDLHADRLTMILEPAVRHVLSLYLHPQPSLDPPPDMTA